MDIYFDKRDRKDLRGISFSFFWGEILPFRCHLGKISIFVSPAVQSVERGCQCQSVLMFMSCISATPLVSIVIEDVNSTSG